MSNECTTCEGTKKVSYNSHTIPCPSCRGTGMNSSMANETREDTVYEVIFKKLGYVTEEGGSNGYAR